MWIIGNDKYTEEGRVPKINTLRSMRRRRKRAQMKIIRVYGGRAELHCLYGDGWFWCAHGRRDTPPLHLQPGPLYISRVSCSGMGYARTMRDARRMAVRMLTPMTEAERVKARQTFGEITYG